MQQKKAAIEALLYRYRLGIATKDEQLKIARWLSQLDLPDQPLTDEQVHARLMHARVGLRARLFAGRAPSGRRIRWAYPWGAVAATVAIVSVISALFYLALPRQQPGTEATVMRESITGVGQLKTVVLPDGTAITLNSQSALKFPEWFADSVRDVYLTGEAFFNVQSSPERPFRVHTDRLIVQVLGTSFNVKSYPEDDRFTVAVATGKVAVSAMHKTQTHLLTPGERIDLDRATGVFSQATVNTGEIQLWTTGGLAFRNERLAVIANQLERRYGVTVVFEDAALRNTELSMHTKRESLKVVMEALSTSGGFRYRIAGRLVTIW